MFIDRTNATPSYSTAFTGTLSLPTSGSGEYYIGNQYSSGTGAVVGATIDDVFIFNKAFSQADIDAFDAGTYPFNN